jgi:hypothetical protein
MTTPTPMSHARDNWWTLDFASAFLSPGVNSRGGLVPSPGLTPGTALRAVGKGIDDLRTPESDCWKYIDDTTISEVASKGNTSTMLIGREMRVENMLRKQIP